MATENQSSFVSENCLRSRDLREESLETITDAYFYSTSERMLVTLFYPALLVFGLVGNFAFLAVVAKIPRMQTITNAYLANLAVADFIIICLQMYDILIKYLLSPTVQSSPYATNFGCSVFYGLLYILGFGSTFIVLFVSSERYSAICKPLKHRAIATKKHTKKMILLAWLLGLVNAVIQVLRLGKVEKTCILWPESIDSNYFPKALTACKPFYPSFKSIILIIQFIPFLICSLVSSVMYFNIIKDLNMRKSHSGVGKQSLKFNHAAQADRNKVAVLLITTGLVFFATTMPFHILHLNTVILEYSNLEVGFTLSIGTYGLLIKMFRGILVLNSVVNPLIYSVTSPAYRKAFVSLFSSCRKEGLKNNSSNTSNLALDTTEMTSK